MIHHHIFSNDSTRLTYLLLLLLSVTVSGASVCEDEAGEEHNRSASLKYKLIAIASILVAGGIGVSLPQLGKRIKALNPENDIFFMIKAFAAGVILATGFVHILPDAFDTLTSPCLEENPWRKFPFAGFIAMLSGIGTLMVDSLASGFYKRAHFNKDKQVSVDVENVNRDDEHGGHVHIHTHGTHGHAHGSAILSQDQQTRLPDLIRKRIISQVS